MARTGGLGRGGCGGWESRRRVGARREASPRRPLRARPPRGPSCCTSFGSPAPSFCVGAAGCSFLRTGLYWGGGSWLLLPESASSGFRESPVGSGFCWERRPEGRRRAGGRAVGEGPALQGDQRTGAGGRGAGIWPALGTLGEEEQWRRERDQGLGSSGRGSFWSDTQWHPEHRARLVSIAPAVAKTQQGW